MSRQHGVLNHWARHVIGEPHVADIDHDGHNWVKEETNFCPPSGPNNNFASYDCIKAGEACQADRPDVDILAIWFHDIVFLENPERDVKDPKGMQEAEQILHVVILPCE